MPEGGDAGFYGSYTLTWLSEVSLDAFLYPLGTQILSYCGDCRKGQIRSPVC